MMKVTLKLFLLGSVLAIGSALSAQGTAMPHPSGNNHIDVSLSPARSGRDTGDTPSHDNCYQYCKRAKTPGDGECRRCICF